jgi:hypothetical protein
MRTLLWPSLCRTEPVTRNTCYAIVYIIPYELALPVLSVFRRCSLLLEVNICNGVDCSVDLLLNISYYDLPHYTAV